MSTAKLEVRTGHPGDQLTNEGGGGYFFFVIEDGTATVTRDGETQLLELFGADFAKLTQDIPELGTTVRTALEAHLPH